MYYPCSENKDADQLRGYREADLRLCFRPCELLVFSHTGSYIKRKKSCYCSLCMYMQSSINNDCRKKSDTDTFGLLNSNDFYINHESLFFAKIKLSDNNF